MKKLSYLIVLALILGLVLTGCSLLSNISQVPATGQSGITYLTKNGLFSNIVGLWHFDEVSGTTAYDSSGNSNDGTFMGDPSWTSGKFGNALSFDGDGDYVLLPNSNTILNTNTFTIETWFKTSVNHPAYGGTEGRIVNLARDNAGYSAVALYVEENNVAVCYRNTTAFKHLKHAVNYYDDVWHHIAVTYNNATYRLYYDGVEVELIDDTFYGFGTSAAYLGTYNGSERFFNGTIDEVRIWNRALTDIEIGDNYLLGDVEIDIKPGSDTNSINLGSHGVVPVAILGSIDFDAATVNPLTVTLSGAEVKVKGHSGNAGSLEDVNGDGYLDLVVQVYTENLDLEIGDVDAVLNAYTYAGPALTGHDVIRIVPPK